MLRITVQKGPLTTRFKLEGKLAHDWVTEAEKAWFALTVLNGNKKIVVDLFDVTFVDDLGWQLLKQLHRAGAKLLGSGPLMSSLIEDIEDAKATETEEALAEAFQKKVEES